MHYKLLGFSEHSGVRRFQFHRIGPLGVIPIPFTVLADTSLARRHHVPLQVLPTLATRLLNATTDATPAGTLTLSESHLCIYAAEEKAAKAEFDARHKRPPRPTSDPQEVPQEQVLQEQAPSTTVTN
jgi:hypothetical protein